MRALAACTIACVSACEIIEPAPPPVELGTFPYHPVVFELDLAILAYHVHAQSMVWPLDPFYEEHAGGRGTSRETFMALVHAWADQRGPMQIDGLDMYRGPGILAGLPENATLDPILYNYARVHPWSDGISNNDGRWTQYLTPRAVTGRIRDVFVAARVIGDGSVAVTQIVPGRVDAD